VALDLACWRLRMQAGLVGEYDRIQMTR